jgi:hypothetical protein
MIAQELETVGEGKVIGHCPFPTVGSVTTQASDRITEPGMLPLEVGLVTGHAVSRVLGMVENGGAVWSMAMGAGHPLVGSRKRVSTGCDRVIEALPLPTLLVVAGPAELRKTGARVLALVIRLVAGGTVVLAGGVEQQPTALGMTVSALCLRVGAQQLEAPGEFGVIESSYVHPGPGSVTCEALSGEAEGHVVGYLRGLIILLVAGQTFGREGAEAPTLIGRMTALAGELKVGPLEEETCGLVDPDARNVLERAGNMAKTAV